MRYRAVAALGYRSLMIFWLKFSLLSGTLGLGFFLGDAAMPARETARALREWAIEQNLMATDIPMPEAAAVPIPIAPPAHFTQQAIDVLHKAGIVYVGCDETRNEVVVFTSRKISKRDRAALPTPVAQGVTFAYEVAGIAQIGNPPLPPAGNVPAVTHQNRFTCGSSIFVGRRSGAGTLGALVSDDAGNLFGLSNNHVCADCNFAPIGLPILAPGSVDVTANGVDPFTIGHHFRGLQMNAGSPDNLAVQHLANLDAAIFRVRDPNLVCSMQKSFYDSPAAAGPIAAGMLVEKVGRSTGRTVGTVRAEIIGACSIQYSMPDLSLDLRVFYEPVFVVRSGTVNGLFSDSGDSGSLVTGFDEQQQRIGVGLVFGGDKKGNSFVLPLVNILNALNVTLVSGHNI